VVIETMVDCVKYMKREGRLERKEIRRLCQRRKEGKVAAKREGEQTGAICFKACAFSH